MTDSRCWAGSVSAPRFSCVNPVRIGALAIVVAVTTAISTILTAALLTISVAFVALVACRIVYPAADRLETAMGGERR